MHKKEYIASFRLFLAVQIHTGNAVFPKHIGQNKHTCLCHFVPHSFHRLTGFLLSNWSHNGQINGVIFRCPNTYVLPCEGSIEFIS